MPEYICPSFTSEDKRINNWYGSLYVIINYLRVLAIQSCKDYLSHQPIVKDQLLVTETQYGRRFHCKEE